MRTLRQALCWAGRGFSLVELMVTLALLGLLATLAVPVIDVQMQRGKEQELRRALLEIRTALDAYHDAARTGRIAQPASGYGYPPDLKTLVEGVEDQQHPQRRRLVFLRRIPADPLQALVAAHEPNGNWGLRSYDSPAEDPKPGADVYDVFSRSTGTGLNGVPYRRW